MENVSEEYVRILVSNNLRRIRSRQNLSQLSLATNAGVTHNFLNQIESCKKGISAKTIAKLCSTLNVEPYQFFLPDGMPDDINQLYVLDFSDTMQKMAKEIPEKYLGKK